MRKGSSPLAGKHDDERTKKCRRRQCWWWRRRRRPRTEVNAPGGGGPGPATIASAVPPQGNRSLPLVEEQRGFSSTLGVHNPPWFLTWCWRWWCLHRQQRRRRRPHHSKRLSRLSAFEQYDVLMQLDNYNNASKPTAICFLATIHLNAMHWKLWREPFSCSLWQECGFDRPGMQFSSNGLTTNTLLVY